jgi:hypothetical protein
MHEGVLRQTLALLRRTAVHKGVLRTKERALAAAVLIRNFFFCYYHLE